MDERVFASENIEIVHAPGRGDGPVFVTFHALDDMADKPRPGFGAAFLAKHGIEAFHVIPKSNAWYQYPEMRQALSEVRARVSAGRTLITYGSSMGGYAAYRFSGLLAAERVIAVSPQYSIARARIPWETRWRHYSGTITPLWDGLEPNRRARTVLFYDPVRDRRHARLIGRDLPAEHVRLPHSGHPCFPMLRELGLLTPAILAIAAGRFDAAACEKEARDRRMDSPCYLAHRALASPWIARGRRRAMAERAIALAPDDPSYRIAMARVLSAEGDVSGADARYREALDMLPDQPALLYAYRRFLAKAGRWEEAEAMVERVLALYPGRLSREQEIGALRAARARARRPFVVRALMWLARRNALDGI